MKNAPDPGSAEDPMLDPAFWSHVVLWAIGGLAALGLVGTVGAFWSMGRAGYRKD